MRNKFNKALIVCLLLTLFSCSGSVSVQQNTEAALIPAVSTVPKYQIRKIQSPLNSSLYEVITPKDTFLVFTQYKAGAVLLK